jgi:hypothetical protein
MTKNNGLEEKKIRKLPNTNFNIAGKKLKLSPVRATVLSFLPAIFFQSF